MKKKITTTRVSVTFMLICILFLIACYYFDFVNQPFTAEPNSSFEVDISVTQSPGNGSDAIPYFGVVLPLGWTVNDSIVFSYGNSFGMLVYSDSLTQLMYTLSPVPLDYYWWVAEGLNELERDIGQTYLFSPVINPSDQPGTYYLDYMLGDNSNGLNYRRSNGHLITVDLPESITVTNSNDSGPGSLRAAIDGVGFYGSIYFDLDPGDTIFLQDQLVINKNISISGPEDNPVVISGNKQHRVLYINEGRNPHLANLHVVNGQSDLGGGIFCTLNTATSLQNVTISNNTADKGGGIYTNGAIVIFDSINRCNIFNNSAPWGNDIYARSAIELYVDVFSVLHPSEYHIFPREYFTCNILNGNIQQVDADLYVSSEGDNSNGGLTTDDPLQTIDFAFCKIRADSLHQNTVHLLEGIYSSTVNNELFPVIVPDFIKISGESETGVILDAEGQSDVIVINQNSATNISYLILSNGINGLYCYASILDLKNLTITSNQGSGIYCYESGLTITDAAITNNSTSEQGGGIKCLESDPILKNVIISNNTSGSNGGGIYFEYCNPYLENVTISYNTSEWGGGIHCYSSEIEFDSINRCNIYLNNASFGNDLRLHSITNVILDTFSVLYPTAFHADPFDNCSFDIMNGILEQVDADLFVSPYGDDTNGGLTTDDPLKTIRHAMLRIMTGSDYQNSVRLMEGAYGPSSNGEIMPFTIPSYYSIRGSSASEVIFDAEGQSGVMIIQGDGVTISDLTVTGGNAEYGGGISSRGDITIQNVIIRDNFASHGAGIDFGGQGNSLLQNVLITDNSAEDRGGAIFSSASSCILKLQNVTISNNEGARGGGFYCSNGAQVTFQSSILSDNTGEIYFLEFNSPGIFYSSWSNINGSIATNGNGYYGSFETISEDPLFTGSGDHPYALSQASPCIDAGYPESGSGLPECDLMGNQRFWDGDGNETIIIDMGAYEYGSVPVGVTQFQVTDYGIRVEVYPNPAAGEIVITYFIPVGGQRSAVGGQVTLRIYDMNGREIATLVDEQKTPGEHTVHFDVSSLPPVVYMIQLQAGEQRVVRKLLVQ